MSSFRQTLNYGLRNLLRFSGRDPRERFWPYAGAVLGAAMAAYATARAADVARTMARMGHADAELPALIPEMALSPTVLPASVVATVALLAAAVTRRLHDRDRSGLWGLLPLPFLAYGLWAFPHIIAQIRLAGGDGPTFAGAFIALLVNNLINIASLVWLAVLLASPSTKGPNRFGGGAVTA